jgi:hypothetical protein
MQVVDACGQAGETYQQRGRGREPDGTGRGDDAGGGERGRQD